MGDAEDRRVIGLHVMDGGVAIDVSGACAERLESEIRTAWSRCLAPLGPDEAQARVTAVLDDPEGLDAVMDALSSQVTIAAIGVQAGSMVMLHACGIADRHGRTVALVAPSGTGKTTAAAVLGQYLGYVSDETVAVRRDGSIAAYPKPLSVKVGGPTVPKRQVAVDDLGAPPDWLRIHRVAFLERTGAEPGITVEPLLESLAKLAPQTSYLRDLPNPLHRLARVLGDAGGLRVLRYAEASQLPALVDALMAESS